MTLIIDLPGADKKSLALIQRVSQVTELARVERLASIKALAEAAQPDR